MRIGQSRQTFGENRRRTMSSSSPASSSPSSARASPRLRSRSFADNIIRGEESYQFEIPTATEPHHATRGRSGTLIEEIDLSLYKNKNEKHTLTVTDTLKGLYLKSDPIGRARCLLQHVKSENKITIQILSIDVNFQPSSFVKGRTWLLQPVLKVEAKKLQSSPKVSRKTSVFTLPQKQDYLLINVGQQYDLPFKHKNLSNFSLRITVCDRNKNHQDLQIGYIHIPVSSLMHTDTMLDLDEEIVAHSEPVNTSHGELKTKLVWMPSVAMLEVKVLSASNLISVSDTKEIYIKGILFIDGEEMIEHKTECMEATNRVIFDHNFQFYLEPTHRIENVSIVLQVFEKHLMSLECIGQTVIGPYMRKTIQNNTLSCWEKLIIDPAEEIIYTADLVI